MPHARPSVVIAAVLVAATSGCLRALWEKQRSPPPAPPPAAPAALAGAIKLELVTRETTEAVALVAAPEPPGRLFVVEKRGPIRILRGTRLDARPFHDLTGKVSLWRGDNGEQGLLGLAFHPQFAQNGRLFINYTDLEGDTRVVELRVDPKDPNRTDPASAREILHVEQPYDNHNAGDLAFGPDGQLHVLLGDGGKADDPHGHGQNPRTLLSKMLRIDVDAGTPAITTYGKGMRNPWRFSFDRKTGDLYIADVGQNVWEWVHVIPAARLAGPHNLGWNITEGSKCFRSSTCSKGDLTPPVVEYSHSEGCSITGGHVYRGKALPELDGVYFYSDYCTALLRSFRYQDRCPQDPQGVPTPPRSFASNKVGGSARGCATDHWDWKTALDPEAQLARVAAFGQDHAGELHIVTHEGPIYKLTRR